MLDTAESSTFPVPAITPIFVIGMPRCGSTLLHQMLSSHDDIGGVGELGILHRELGTWLLDCRDNDKLEKIRLLYLREVEHFLKKTGQVNRKYFVDKSLSNFRYVGLLERLFPSAKFILMTRKDLTIRFQFIVRIFKLANITIHFRIRQLIVLLSCTSVIYSIGRLLAPTSILKTWKNWWQIRSEKHKELWTSLGCQQVYWIIRNQKFR